MQSYIMYFFIYAIVGWILEVSFHVITNGKFINRGFLNGPYCPVYGFGALGVILLLDEVGETSKLLLFFASMAIATILELITGFLLEKIFHKRWWDYSSQKFNLGGYICAEFSLIWGAACFILYEAVHPLIRRAVELMPAKLIISINITIALVFVIDLVSTVIILTGLSQKFEAIENQSKDIRKVSDGIGQRVADKTFQALDKKKELENSRFVKDFDQRSIEFRSKFNSFGEKRLLRAYPNLLKDLEDKWEAKRLIKKKEED